MNYIVVKDYEELSRKAANLIAAQVILKPDSVLGLATGSSPVGTYKKLAEMNKAGDVDFSKVTSVNLDEYEGLDGTNDQSYRYFMDTNLFNNINIDKKKTYVPNGCAADLKKEGERYDNLIEELAQEVVSRTAILFDAIKPKGGEMPVVMGAGSSGILLHEAIGHAFEADFNRLGTSIFSDKLGKTICNPLINVVDDGTIPHNRGSINFDDEGIEGQKTYIVAEGKLNSYLHDRISARHYGVQPTGNGRRESFRYTPMPRMRATYMESGPHTEEDMIANIKHGVYVDVFSNGQVQIGAGDFTFYVKSGWLIENGRLTTPIKDINVIGNGPEALAAISMVGNNPKIDNGTWTCGKEGQSCAVTCGMPSVLIDKLTVGGE